MNTAPFDKVRLTFALGVSLNLALGKGNQKIPLFLFSKLLHPILNSPLIHAS